MHVYTVRSICCVNPVLMKYATCCMKKDVARGKIGWNKKIKRRMKGKETRTFSMLYDMLDLLEVCILIVKEESL